MGFYEVLPRFQAIWLEFDSSGGQELSTMSTEEDLEVVGEKALGGKYIVPLAARHGLRSASEGLERLSKTMRVDAFRCISEVFVVFIITRALDRIFLYRVQKSMADYTAAPAGISCVQMVLEAG